jgi:hypothetical protein
MSDVMDASVLPREISRRFNELHLVLNNRTGLQSSTESVLTQLVDETGRMAAVAGDKTKTPSALASYQRASQRVSSRLRKMSTGDSAFATGVLEEARTIVEFCGKMPERKGIEETPMRKCRGQDRGVWGETLRLVIKELRN